MKTTISSTSKMESAVILPYVKEKVLMQLRDFKSDIFYPGHWGFFGGSVDDGENPDETAKRELFEEIGYRPKVMHKLSTSRVPEWKGFIVHSYCCPLTKPVENIELKEGADIGLFSLEDVVTGNLYSPKMKKKFPIIEVPHIIETIKTFLEYIKSANNI